MSPVTRVNALALELSGRILRLCSERGLAKGARLTERRLAEALGVSRSPVRSALKALEERGLVARGAGGCELAIDADELATLTLHEPAGADDDLYMRILRDRFSGTLSEHPSEADLIRAYGVTRGALAKVLARLTQDGYAQRSPARGWTFSPTLASLEAYRDSYEFRLAIEPAALASSHYRPDRARIERLLDQHRGCLARDPARITGLEWFALDAELHEMLVSFSGNQFFLQAMRSQNRLRRAVEIESFYADERVRDSFDEHIAILEALLRDDRAWAATLLTRHLQLARESTEVFLAKAAPPAS